MQGFCFSWLRDITISALNWNRYSSRRKANNSRSMKPHFFSFKEVIKSCWSSVRSSKFPLLFPFKILCFFFDPFAFGFFPVRYPLILPVYSGRGLLYCFDQSNCLGHTEDLKNWILKYSRGHCFSDPYFLTEPHHTIRIYCFREPMLMHLLNMFDLLRFYMDNLCPSRATTNIFH